MDVFWFLCVCDKSKVKIFGLRTKHVKVRRQTSRLGWNRQRLHLLPEQQDTYSVVSVVKDTQRPTAFAAVFYT